VLVTYERQDGRDSQAQPRPVGSGVALESDRIGFECPGSLRPLSRVSGADFVMTSDK
jgi:hypothetical protein